MNKTITERQKGLEAFYDHHEMAIVIVAGILAAAAFLAPFILQFMRKH